MTSFCAFHSQRDSLAACSKAREKVWELVFEWDININRRHYRCPKKRKDVIKIESRKPNEILTADRRIRRRLAIGFRKNSLPSIKATFIEISFLLIKEISKSPFEKDSQKSENPQFKKPFKRFLQPMFTFTKRGSFARICKRSRVP